MSVKSQFFFSNLKDNLKKIEEKVAENYKIQFSEPEKHYCYLDAVNLDVDCEWEEFTSHSLEMIWRCGTEDETSRTISTYISIQSLINADNIFDAGRRFARFNGWRYENHHNRRFGFIGAVRVS